MINLDKVLADVERAGAIISGYKLDFCYSSMLIVGYKINKFG